MSEERNVVTPLRHFLNKASVDDLLAFLHGLHLRYTLGCDAEDKFFMEIRQDAMFKYRGTGDSAKTAIVNAVAHFMASEQKDFHEYVRRGAKERGHEQE